jgi:hypothetical protein
MIEQPVEIKEALVDDILVDGTFVLAIIRDLTV